MSNYKVTQAQLDQLNQIVGESGTIPSDVNKHLGDADAKLAAKDYPGCHDEIIAGSKDNDRNGKAYSAIQSWHDMIEGQPIGEDGGTPADPGPPVGSEAPFGTGKNLHQGVIYTQSGSGKSKCSWAISSGGYPCFASFDKANMGAGHTGGTPWIESPAGSWVYYMVYAADPGRVQDGTLNVVPA